MIQVEKEIPLTLDVGSLAAFDISVIDAAKMGTGKERSKFLKVSGLQKRLLFTYITIVYRATTLNDLVKSLPI